MDLKDKKIINALESYARKPFSKVAKEVGLSRELVAYRYKRLCDNGIIHSSYALMDPAKIGFGIFRVLFRLATTKEGETAKLVEYFGKDNSVMWFASVGGRWDLIAEFLFGNAFEFNEKLNEVLKKFKENVLDYDVSIVLTIKFYEIAYLLPRKEERKIKEIGGKIDNVKLHSADRKILNELKNNARATSIQLSKKLGMSRNTINSRINRLSEKKVLLGFKLFPNHSKIGKQQYKILINLRNFGLLTEKKFFSFAEANKSTLYALKNFGKWNAEIEVAVKDAEEVQNVSAQLRELFQQDLTDIEIIPIFRDYKINLMPPTE